MNEDETILTKEQQKKFDDLIYNKLLRKLPKVGDLTFDEIFNFEKIVEEIGEELKDE